MTEQRWLQAPAVDTGAFANLYDKHITSVYRYALQMLGSVPDAEDISQEVFVLAWVKRSKIRVVDQSLLPWLLVTTQSQLELDQAAAP
jgi:DNA-directed RNA polymerase specialized sigma24 family protein